MDLPSASELTTPITQDGGPFTPVYNVGGGVPGGNISLSDPDGNYYYFYAPSKFLGSQAAAYGGSFSFDMEDTDAGNGVNPHGEDLILVGTSGVTVTHALTLPATTTFTHEVVSLSASGWTNLGTGQAASAANMQSTLGSLQSLYILGDFENGSDTAFLDNVTLTASPEPSQLAAFSLGVIGVVALGLRARRRVWKEM